MRKKAFLFGYGGHGRAIAQSLKKDNYNVVILESNEENIKACKSDGFKYVLLIDVTKDAELEALEIKSSDQLICVMDDEHLNVFLTLSLRSIYSDCFIISISYSLHTTQKLKKAGADKVISLHEVSANRIHNILRRPNATKLLDSFITDRADISFREMTIPKGSTIDGQMASDVDFGADHVLLIGMVDEELSQGFVFIAAGIEHKLDAGDTIVCIGKNADLKKFEKKIGIEEIEE